MSLSFVACIKLVVTQKSFAKCWRVMCAGRLLTDFRTALSTWALTVCCVIFLVAFSPTSTNSSRMAPSFSSQANASSLSAPIRDVPEGPAKGSPLVSLTWDIRRRVDRSVAAVCRYCSACSRPGRLERDNGPTKASDDNSTRRKDNVYGNTRATSPSGPLPDGNRLLYLARDLRRCYTRDCRPARPRPAAIQHAGEGDRNACGIAHKSAAPPGKRRSVYRAGRSLLCADSARRMPANGGARIDALCCALVCRHHAGGVARLALQLADWRAGISSCIWHGFLFLHGTAPGRGRELRRGHGGFHEGNRYRSCRHVRLLAVRHDCRRGGWERDVP